MNDNMLVPVAGNGLLPLRALNRRQLLAGIGAGALALPSAALAAGGRPSWMQGAGAGMRSYGTPSPAETVSRVAIASQPGTTGSGASRTTADESRTCARRIAYGALYGVSTV